MPRKRKTAKQPESSGSQGRPVPSQPAPAQTGESSRPAPAQTGGSSQAGPWSYPSQRRSEERSLAAAHGQDVAGPSNPPPPTRALGAMSLRHGPPNKVSGQVTRAPPQRRAIAAPAAPSAAAARDVDLAVDAFLRLRSSDEPFGKVPLPRRPDYGVKGTPMKLVANHFLTTFPRNLTLIHYDVVITPADRPGGRPIANKRLCRAVFNAMLQQNFPNRRQQVVYDNMKNCYAASELYGTGPADFPVRLQEPDEDRVRPFVVTLKEASRPDITDLWRFLEGVQTVIPQDVITALDMVLREDAVNRLTPIGRSFFDNSQFGRPHAFGGGVEGWPGFFVSLRPKQRSLHATQNGMSLIIDQSVAPVLKAQPVLALVAEMFPRRPRGAPLSERERRELKKGLRTIRVAVTHRGAQRAKYTIRDISLEPVSSLTFDMEGQRVTVLDYFRQHYPRVQLQPNMPALQVGVQKITYMPMDVCTILPGQRFGPKLSPDQIGFMQRQTAVKPGERRRKIEEIRVRNAYEKDPYAGAFGLAVSPQMTPVQGRHLPSPALQYGKNQVVTPDSGEGKWDIRNKPVLSSSAITPAWGVLNFSYGIEDNQIEDFFNRFLKECRSMGVSLGSARQGPIMYGEEHDPAKALADAMAQTGGKLQLLFCIFDKKFTVHDDIKAICETQLGIVSQCILKENMIPTMQRDRLQLKSGLLQNLALKVNVKMGGVNCVLRSALSRQIPGLTDKETIIFGADVSHPSPGDTSFPSLAALVGSTDWPQATKYAARLHTQSRRQEMIVNLAEMARELLEIFRDKHGVLPKRIIFYRDGVSEGQFMEVLVREVAALREACDRLGYTTRPQITFVVVQKRHHTRFFPAPGEKADRNGNVQPGTVVDMDVCHPSEFDFYLNSHASIQGTSKSSHYHVLYDENGFTADVIQMLTYHLCYTYARCARSVSVVPPAYYAHLAAERARAHLTIVVSSDTASQRSGGDDGAEGPLPQLPEVKAQLRSQMFYC